ncbi:hypothetical protein GCM10010421_49300 [Streptomyces glaucus]|uniref:Uncharacterized protein n=1 Tax=Streptomyces glaucus TaxID=284029 RepID=A0ABN3K6M3_9ACTN
MANATVVVPAARPERFSGGGVLEDDAAGRGGARCAGGGQTGLGGGGRGSGAADGDRE